MLIDPNDLTKGKYKPKSRVELATLGGNNIENTDLLFKVKQGVADTITIKHLTFNNNLKVNKFLITELRAADISASYPPVLIQQQDTVTIKGGAIWSRTFNDNSRDFVVYNPSQDTLTVQGIRSNAKVWLLHANISGNWSVGSLFGAKFIPQFPGFPTAPSVISHNGTAPTSGNQYEIIF